MRPLLRKEPDLSFTVYVLTLSVTLSGVVCSRRMCNVQTHGKTPALKEDSGGIEVNSNFAANVWEVIY